ncbi:sugar phosphate isomerase/epimerase family protein [Bremerella alba]|uniref:Xylose isomerase-like TIM barrel domain-containing protein n=1 Tax=Bremerella alba TaxID=980252 RepID=A0A7V9A618_9BACT|nr:sugar phosphate isomerase/epimerase [Bremerella alba]MBA2113792.1 hypothetical protein [Bremerella alba]
MPISRRQLLHSGLAFAGTMALAPSPSVADTTKPSGCTLGFSTYGMKTLKTEAAIEAISEIGYDAIEIAVRPDWDSAPSKMPAKRRAAVGRLLRDKQLHLSALMEHLQPAQDDQQHHQHLDRLSQVFTLAEDWQTHDSKPLVQTTLGGGNWEKLRTFYLDRIGDWAEVARKHDVVLAIKPHRGGGMSRPSEAVWLIQQLGNPRHLKMVYDYSHYAYRDMTLEETIDTALPHTAHIALKDVMQHNGKFSFQLPGKTGEVDFSKLFRLFYAGGYRGDLNCEVSGMVWGQPDYEPIPAARQAYCWMSQALQTANVPRV